MTGPWGSACVTSSWGARPITCHRSFSILRPWITRSGMGRLLAVDTRLEGRDADALHGVHEELVVVALADVGVDELRDDVGHLGGGERRPDHVTQGGVIALPPADGHLVE